MPLIADNGDDDDNRKTIGNWMSHKGLQQYSNKSMGNKQIVNIMNVISFHSELIFDNILPAILVSFKEIKAFVV